MPTIVIEVEQDLINEIMRLREAVKASVNAVMEERLTGSHLATEVSMLLEQLDHLDGILATATAQAEAAQPAPGQPEQPAAAPAEPPAAQTQ